MEIIDDWFEASPRSGQTKGEALRDADASGQARQRNAGEASLKIIKRQGEHARRAWDSLLDKDGEFAVDGDEA